MSEEREKVVSHPYFQTNNKTTAYSGKIEEKNILDDGEDDTMGKETYSKSEIDLKFDKISSDFQHNSEKTDLQINSLKQEIISQFEISNLRMEKMISDFESRQKEKRDDEEKERKKDKRELTLWIIGTTVGTIIGILGIIVPLLKKIN